jgi:hypothetical protein
MPAPPVTVEIKARQTRNNSTFMTACNNGERHRQNLADDPEKHVQYTDNNRKRASVRLAPVTDL